MRVGSAVKRACMRRARFGARHWVAGILAWTGFFAPILVKAEPLPPRLESVGLPNELLLALERAATMASDGAEERLIRARLAADLSQLLDHPPFTPSMDVSWSAASDLEPRADVLATVRGWLLNPASERDAVRAKQLARDAALQSLIRETEHLRVSLLAWLSLWRTTQQLHLLALLADSPLPVDGDAANRHASLLSHRDRLAFDAGLQLDELMGGLESDLRWLADPGAWNELLLSTIPACVEGDANVMLAMRALQALRHLQSSEASSARLPAIQVGADLGLVFPGNLRDTVPSLVGWLEVGAPPDWSVVGSLRLNLSSDEARVSLSLAPSPEQVDPPPSLMVESAERTLEESIRSATRTLDSDSFDLDRLRKDLPWINSTIRPDRVTVDSIEAALGALDEVSYGVELQLHRLLACEREHVWRNALFEEGT